MVLDLKSYIPQKISSHIKIIAATTDSDFQQWAAVASETFGCSIKDIKDFFLPWIQTAGDVPYLAFYDDEPTATSLVFCGKKAASV